MADDKPITAEGLTAALREALASFRGSREDDDDVEPRSGKVPYERFFRANERMKAAEAALEALSVKVTEFQTAQAAALEAHQTKAADAVTALQRRHLDDLALVDHGVTDPHGREALRAYWNALPKEGRGKAPGEWWGSQVEALTAHRADPEKAEAPQLPRTLVGYLPAAEVEQENGKPKPKARAGNPDANRSTGAQKDLATRIAEAQATGDWPALQAALAEADA